MASLRLVNRKWASIAEPYLFEAVQILPNKPSSNRACAVAASPKKELVRCVEFVACLPDENREYLQLVESHWKRGLFAEL